MTRKSRHNATVRSRLISGAAALFRRHGYDGVNIDTLMASAGLTRGAFYAHFKTKAALFAAVVAEDHPLLSRLEARTGQGSQALWAEAMETFRGYLAPENLSAVHAGCTLAALSRDVALAPPETQSGFAEAHHRILAEMARGQDFDATAPEVIAALTLASGAVSSAAAMADADQKARTLTSAWLAFETILAPLAPTEGVG